MRGVYVVSAENQTVVGATTLLGFVPPGSTAIEIRRIWVSQSANATSAQQRIEIYSQASTFASGGLAVTPQKTWQNDQASSLSGNAAVGTGHVMANAGTEGAGAVTVLWPDAFNVLNGWFWKPDETETICFPANTARAFGIRFPVAPATLTGWTFGMTYRELG